MNELSLFTGAGGGVLGTHHLLGWKTCGYVEWNEYCQRVIAARIADGYLTSAPIFTDVREFVQSGAAEQYRGIADVVAAGFPCQPFSVAGKQLAANDERNMWPATRDVIRIVQPTSVLLENVPGLVSCGYIGTVIADLAALGYVGRWGVIGAADAGAPHKRDRLWIVADASCRRRSESGERKVQQPWRAKVVGSSQAVADAASKICDGREHHAGCDSQHAQAIPQLGNRRDAADVADPDATGRQELHAATITSRQGSSTGAPVGWWLRDPGDEPESGVGRVADGVAHRVDRLKATGNGQVSIVAARAWRELAA